MRSVYSFSLFFFNDTATTEIYTLSLHDALPISTRPDRASGRAIESPGHLRRRRAPDRRGPDRTDRHPCAGLARERGQRTGSHSAPATLASLVRGGAGSRPHAALRGPRSSRISVDAARVAEA